MYLYSEDSRLPDQSPDAYRAAWGTQETHTAPHLPARLRLALRTYGKVEIGGREKREVEES